MSKNLENGKNEVYNVLKICRTSPTCFFQTKEIVFTHIEKFFNFFFKFHHKTTMKNSSAITASLSVWFGG